MNIRQGDIYWLRAGAGVGAGVAHPHVIIAVNPSSQSVVACALTTNLKRASLPGYVLLDAGEAGLPRASVVEVSKTVSVEMARLGAYMGALSERRLEQVLAGWRFVQSFYFSR